MIEMDQRERARERGDKSGEIEIVRMRVGGRNFTLSKTGYRRRRWHCFRGLEPNQVGVQVGRR